METQPPPSDLDQLRDVIREDLRAGAIVDLPRVARRLGTSKRTLQRVIARGGGSFRDLVQGVRHQMALELLGRGDVTIEHVSAAVGYADSKALRRAFHRWGEPTPSSVRARLKSTPPPPPEAEPDSAVAQSA